jgi:hypothetical protein
MKWTWFALLPAVLAVGVFAEILEDASFLEMEHPAIRFNMQRTTMDRVAQLDGQLEAGRVKLAFDSRGQGYLKDLLRRLEVPVDSQVLVFSKTSIQNTYISPRTPRALYFNDDTMVGYIPGAEDLELTALDPVLGVQPYTMNADSDVKPSFARRDDCLRCHMGNATLGVPGLLVSSVHPAVPDRARHGSSYLTDQDTPFAERWGGWYVTGRTGEMTHYGNSATLVNPITSGPLVPEGRTNVMDISDRFTAAAYPLATSDIVALMTLEHQVRMTNILVRLGWEARIREFDKKPLDDMDWQFDEAVRYMMFAGSPVLPSPVEGASTFTRSFPARGPKDAQGRSLRDFDLKTRLFRYPLSYMIYTMAFDKLPPAAKTRLYQKLDAILRGGGGDKFKTISAQDRQAVREIVAATKKDLPAFWNN